MFPRMISVVPPHVQEAMKAKGLKMRDIVEKTGLSRPTARSIMCGEKITRNSPLRDIAKAKIEKIIGISL
jgi:transcriptional regulator with XRE-family HTH domain